MPISLRQTLAQLAAHTHAYDAPSFSGEASYQAFLSYPNQYANLLLPFNDPNQPSRSPVQTGPPMYPSVPTGQSGE
jgi:hypothetical protein